MLCGAPHLGDITAIYVGALVHKAWLCSALLEEGIKAGFLGCLCCCLGFSRGSCGRALGCGPPESRPLGSYALSSFVLIEGSLPTYQSTRIESTCSQCPGCMYQAGSVHSMSMLSVYQAATPCSRHVLHVPGRCSGICVTSFCMHQTCVLGSGSRHVVYIAGRYSTLHVTQNGFSMKSTSSVYVR